MLRALKIIISLRVSDGCPGGEGGVREGGGGFAFMKTNAPANPD